MSNTIEDNEVDLLIVGAGPAGMASALQARELGIQTLVVDEKGQPGGQIYAGHHGSPDFDRSFLGKDYAKGRSLIDAFMASDCRRMFKSLVWDISQDGHACMSDGSQTSFVLARHVILASGALERAFPFEGWTLPGVMTAGGAQILLKTAGIVPSHPVVLAGSGPLLLLLATQFLACGVPVSAVLDTTPASNWRRATPFLAGFLSSRLAAKGAAMLLRLRASGIPVLGRVTQIRAIGNGKIETVEYRHEGQIGRLQAETLIVHQGIEPETRLARVANANHAWDARTRSWLPACDEFGRTSIPHISVAGDGRAILGADAAPATGRIAAIDAAFALGRIDRDTRQRLSDPLFKELRRLGKPRKFIDALFSPFPGLYDNLNDSTLVCRCEEIPAARIREEARRSSADINSVKSRLRCGMGPCQGRFCETTVRELLLRTAVPSCQEVGQLRIRPPIKPVGVEEIISLGVKEIPPESRIPLEPRA
ncbi:pyruvate/2-oxoglutarate dehydrogenase complex dihydrolipoamide dehydrogenase (E3) component [Mesorhizobium sp. J18]|uniref:NAD(P)/FAD-dependent oxidoreductase n=1 Tax=Mesorhizobium sp. J18 TaxID=935263 RepID=UPI00119BDFE9|nr:NAD(P)/FAD-dependent oxidoreductase [Mesorhizobium sp. J18]TWG91795.1 pyruvate/2-oxoglutarate dehydrogenase complex dihydrolipoamide dehydrogenase (E3) component [Mesorhizobium sp. J18]